MARDGSGGAKPPDFLTFASPDRERSAREKEKNGNKYISI
jgi:hypothetical protein